MQHLFYVIIAKHQCKLLVVFLRPLTWDVFQIIVDILSIVVSVCHVLNQFHGHWFTF